MTAPDALEATREAVAALQAAVELRREYGETLGIRRISSDVERFLTDFDELRPAPERIPPAARPDQLEEIPDEPWTRPCGLMPRQRGMFPATRVHGRG